jgi:Mor family transcriptional regulator
MPPAKKKPQKKKKEAKADPKPVGFDIQMPGVLALDPREFNQTLVEVADATVEDLDELTEADRRMLVEQNYTDGHLRDATGSYIYTSGKTIPESVEKAVVADWITGSTVYDLSHKHHISASGVRRILEKPEYRHLKDVAFDANFSMIADLMSDKVPQIQQMTEKYMALAMSDQVMVDTPIDKLMNVWTKVMGMSLKVYELDLKRRELAVRLEESRADKRKTENIIGEFTEMMQGMTKVAMDKHGKVLDGAEVPEHIRIDDDDTADGVYL